MGDKTKIAWSDATFNPWLGCSPVSAACHNRYAQRYFKHFKLKPGERRRTSAANWKKPLAWNRQAKKDGTSPRVLCGSLCDVFENHPTANALRDDLLSLIDATTCLTYMLLTKRPGNIRWMVPCYSRGIAPENVWLGVTVENQQMADKRIPELLSVPASKHFLSLEPLLGHTDLDRVNGCLYDRRDNNGNCWQGPGLMSWVLAGCESGPRARPSETDWFRSLRDQCAEAGIPFFLKQMMIDGQLVREPFLDGRQHLEAPE